MSSLQHPCLGSSLLGPTIRTSAHERAGNQMLDAWLNQNILGLLQLLLECEASWCCCAVWITDFAVAVCTLRVFIAHKVGRVFSLPTYVIQHTSLQHFSFMLGDAQLVSTDAKCAFAEFNCLSSVVAINCCAVLCKVMMCYNQ